MWSDSESDSWFEVSLTVMMAVEVDDGAVKHFSLTVLELNY